METNAVIKTKDGQEIDVGVEIYYTGDMANPSGTFRVDKIYTSRFYPVLVDLVELNTWEAGRTFRGLTPASFEPGPGTRFLTMAKYMADRQEKIRKLQEVYGPPTPPKNPSQFDLLKTLEWGQEYTLVKYGEFGFLFSVKFKLLEVRVQPYAQYPESVMLVGKPYKKRNAYGWRILPQDRFAIWRGYKEVRTSMWVQQENAGSATIKRSLLSCDGEYLRMALDSVVEPPLIVKREFGTGKE